MKIICINGSPRVNGLTGQIVKNVIAELERIDKSIYIENVNLGEYDLKLCSGCLSCYKTGECFIKDDGIESLSHKIAEADGVIFASPTYESNVSGHMKVMFDRGHFIFEQLLYKKPCISIVTYENAGGTDAIKIINKFIRLSGGAVVGQIKVKANHGTKLSSKEINLYIKRQCTKFVKVFTTDNPLSWNQKLMNYIIFNFGLKPHALKNPNRYQAIIKRWENINLVKS